MSYHAKSMESTRSLPGVWENGTKQLCGLVRMENSFWKGKDIFVKDINIILGLTTMTLSVKFSP